MPSSSAALFGTATGGTAKVLHARRNAAIDGERERRLAARIAAPLSGVTGSRYVNDGLKNTHGARTERNLPLSLQAGVAALWLADGYMLVQGRFARLDSSVMAFVELNKKKKSHSPFHFKISSSCSSAIIAFKDACQSGMCCRGNFLMQRCYWYFEGHGNQVLGRRTAKPNIPWIYF